MMPRSAAWGRNSFITLSSSPRRSNTLGRSLNWPASIRAISRMSPINPTRASPGLPRRVEQSLLGRRQPGVAQHRQCPEQGVQRRTDLVTDDGDEAGLRLDRRVGDGGRFAACVLDLLARGDIGIDRDQAAVGQPLVPQLRRYARPVAGVRPCRHRRPAQQGHAPCHLLLHIDRPELAGVRLGAQDVFHRQADPQKLRGTPETAGNCSFHSARQNFASIIATPSEMPPSVACELRCPGVGVRLARSSWE